MANPTTDSEQASDADTIAAAEDMPPMVTTSDDSTSGRSFVGVLVKQRLSSDTRGQTSHVPAYLTSIDQQLVSASSRAEEIAVVNAVRVRNHRQSLIDGGSVSVAQLSEGRGTNPNAVHQWLRRCVDGHKLVAVTIDGTTRVPLVFLDTAFDVIPAWQPVLEALAVFDDAWLTWAWCEEPTAWLGERRPVDLIATDPDTVVAAAARKVAASTRPELANQGVGS